MEFKILKLRVAAYIRISKKEKEVNSISNQKDLIDYYIKDKEDMKIYNYYVDNGYSGTNFDRPELKRMLKDIFSGYLKCIECDSNLTIRKSKEYTYYTCSSHVRKRGCNNKHTVRKDILEEKVITEINNRQAKKIDKLNRKYIYDLINMIYLNQDGSMKIEFKMK